MKPLISLLFSFLLLQAGASAQPGFARRTVEERVAVIHAKMDSAFKLQPAVAAQVDSVFAAYYRAMDKAREELMASGERPSREAMQEKLHPITEAREEKLKDILPEKQYETWKKEIEPGLRPQRPNRGN
jgi:hypothetical protein